MNTLTPQPAPVLAQGVPTYGRFQTLGPAQVLPEGWLERYTRLNAGAWLLHYARNRDPEVYSKFWQRNPTAKIVFSENNETLTLCDYAAYFADGMLRYAALCPDSELAAEAETWLEHLLASQDADGYIGAFEPGARWQHWLEVFSQSLMFEALLFQYELSGLPALLSACERAARLQMEAWYRPGAQVNLGIFSGHGAIAVRALLKLCALTGDVSYLNFARDIMAKYGRTGDFLTKSDGLMYEHNAVGAEHAGLPAMLYEYAGDPALLQASRAAWQMMLDYHLSVDGTPHGNESMQFKGPLHNCEHCGAVEWFYTSNALARITADVKYADAAERAMYNAYPAARSPDGMMVAYMHTPNQLVASEWSQPHAWTSPDWCASRQHYHSAHEPLCCNVNGPRGLAYLVESMVIRAGDGLALVYYGPCRAQAALPGAGTVTLEVDTDYPFEDEVRITVSPAQPATFPLLLRVPGWCSGAALSVNGELWPAAPGQYARIERSWQPGDRVVLRLECPVRLERWARSEFGLRAGGVTAERGALSYALPVPEDWQRFEPPARGPGQGVVAYRVLPAAGAEWNFALVLDPERPEASFTPVRLPVPAAGRPWEHPPLGLQVRARKVLNWQMQGEPEHPVTPNMPFLPLRLGDEESTVTLVPFGFTHLRLAILPVAGG